VKLEITLADEDVEFLDEYANSRGLPSRAAVIERAVRLLRDFELAAAYAAAWEEWSPGPHEEPWETTLADGPPPIAGSSSEITVP